MNKKLYQSVLQQLLEKVSNTVGEDELPLIIRRQGSFMVGGAVMTEDGTYDSTQPLDSAGQTLHGDHAYVFFQEPLPARRYPLVFLHGAGQSGKSFETTPDGRDGFQNIFLRENYSVYIVDQPRRGRAGQGLQGEKVESVGSEMVCFEAFRLGQWPNFYPTAQFSRDPEALNQFFRQATPNCGPYDGEVVALAMSALFERIGDGVLVTHSQGSGPGWWSVVKNSNIRGVVCFEPGGGMIFPAEELPEPKENNGYYGALGGVTVALTDFLKLTKIPILIIYGDYIPDRPTLNKGQDNWRARMLMAGDFVTAINRHGGDAKLIRLPQLGSYG
ncbi:MAG: alpha/beta fold hydrolase, partial [Victivallaceae bacterium]